MLAVPASAPVDPGCSAPLSLCSVTKHFSKYFDLFYTIFLLVSNDMIINNKIWNKL
jgi:hypothetical protein